MLNHTELLNTATELSNKTCPSDADLRRAVSTAYYALFHKFLTEASDTLIGNTNRNTAGYKFIYRGYNHGHMKEMCKKIQGTLGSKLQSIFNCTDLDQNIQEFATAFIDLQEKRHLADYDPQANFPQSDVQSIVNSACTAFSLIDNAPQNQKLDVMALLLFGSR